MRANGYLLIVAWLICFCVLNVLVKNLSTSTAQAGVIQQILSMARSPILYIAACLYGGCALLYFLSLGQMPLSTAGPLFMVLGIVATSSIGAFFFQENVSFVKISGLAICVIGIAIVMSTSKV